MSEHSKFSTKDPPIMNHGNIFPPLTSANKRTKKLVARLNKIKLDDRLDLSKHPASKELVNLPQKSVDNLAGGLSHDVGMAEQYTKWKNTKAKEFE